MKTNVTLFQFSIYRALFIMFLLGAMTMCGQERITLNGSIDTGLLFLGDDKGNAPGTIDYNIRSEWQGKQKYGRFWFINTSGYMFIAPEFEYANLEGGIYRRYSANVGYTFNEFFKNTKPISFYANNGRLFTFDPSKLNFSASLGYGVIDYNGGYRGFGTNFQIAYELTPGIWFYVDAEFVDRKDLEIYGESEIRFSGKAGVKVQIANTKIDN